MNNSITIFTPTFNRAHLLKKLYDSILLQKSNNFEWLIVDDGSTDDTETVVNKFIEEKKINIRYYKKTNGGKHSAINFGLQNTQNSLFFIIDSDDVLTENAVEIINNKWEEIKNNEKICGIIGLSGYQNGKIVGDYFLEDDWQVSFSDVYLKYHLKGDKSVAFKTEVLKKYPFPEKEGIRFVFEAVVWHEMSKKYDVLATNTIIQIKEYLKEGITDSSYKKWYIKSLAFSYFNLIKNRTYSLNKYPPNYLWNYIHLAINSLLSGDSYFRELPKVKDKFLYLVMFPRAYYSYLKLKKLVLHDW